MEDFRRKKATSCLPSFVSWAFQRPPKKSCRGASARFAKACTIKVGESSLRSPIKGTLKKLGAATRKVSLCTVGMVLMSTFLLRGAKDLGQDQSAIATLLQALVQTTLGSLTTWPKWPQDSGLWPLQKGWRSNLQFFQNMTTRCSTHPGHPGSISQPRSRQSFVQVSGSHEF